MEKLQHGDVITADRGFNIQEMFACKGVKVNVPPYKEDFTSRRIHDERAMKRIRNYHIFDFVAITLCKNGIIDMIFFVCTMLSNFLLPLVDGQQ